MNIISCSRDIYSPRIDATHAARVYGSRFIPEEYSSIVLDALIPHRKIIDMNGDCCVNQESHGAARGYFFVVEYIEWNQSVNSFEPLPHDEGDEDHKRG